MKTISSSQTLLKKAVAWFGADLQCDKTIEECGELIVALSHRFRRPTKTVDILEELADVLIMAAQLKIIYGKYEVDHHVHQKLERLERIIGEATR